VAGINRNYDIAVRIDRSVGSAHHSGRGVGFGSGITKTDYQLVSSG
jgi:hypothetical protein